MRPARAGQFHIDGRTFTLPDGFSIEKVAGPPMVNRPVVADFDERGRLYVDDSSGSGEDLQTQLRKKPHRVVRLEDTRGDGHFDHQSVFADQIMFPEGAMWFAGSLYVGAPPSIWKLTDAHDAGVADQRSEWFSGKTLTHCGNDIHGPYLGPDGWIYWCKGAFAEQTYPRPGRKPLVTRAAHIFRARPDGSGIEPVMTGGMDNPVHVVFTPGGERIFTTTFLENPAGGHRDGIIHAIYGGLYGKIHDVIDDQPHTSPDVMPVLVHLGPAAACGLARYEPSTFGHEFDNNLFATCFNLHKVTRHVLTPDGATFTATNQDFLVCDSLDFHPTDVIEDADGSLLVIDTGGWYKLCCPTSQLGKPDVLGAIYRVRRTGAKPLADPRGLKLDWNSMGAHALAGLLDDPRFAVRRRAIQALAGKGVGAVAEIEQVLKESKEATARLNAVWAATWINDPAARAAARIALRDSDETVRQAAAHSASVWRDRTAMPQLLELLAGHSRSNRRVAAEAIGRLGDPAAIPPLLKALRDPLDRALDCSLTYALIEIASPAETRAGLSSDNPAVRRSAMIALDQMEAGGVDAKTVAAALNDPDAALRDTAAWIAGRHPAWGQALADAFGGRISTPTLSGDDRARLEQQLARLAASPAIGALLVERLGDVNAPSDQRRLVLAAMAQANLNQPPASWLDQIAAVLDGSDLALLPTSIDAVSRLPVHGPAAEKLVGPLLHVAARQDLPAEVRLKALGAIPGNSIDISADLFTFLAEALRPDRSADERLTAAQVLGRSKLSADELSTLTESIKSASPLQINPLLAAFGQTSDPVVGRKLAAALQGAKALTSLRAQVVRERLAKFGPEVQSQLDTIVSRLNPDATQQKARLDQLQASLTPGDVRRGQLVFNSAKTACASCHSIGYVGGNVGPDLTRVGAIRSERDLLESIVYPSASFVQSFEPTMVITFSGDNQYGIVRSNDADAVTLLIGPNREVRIPRKDIKEMRPGTVSVMPAGFGELLSPQELSDLIAFLKACK